MDRRTLLGGAGASALLAPEADNPLETTWRDRGRNRDIPVLIRLPRATGAAPVILLSHGLGGTRHGLAYLGRALADAGYVAIHLQHAGSDDSVWRGQGDPRQGMAAAARNPLAALARLRDVAFALDEVLDRDALPLPVDRARVAIAGHSFGAWTASHMLGEKLPIPVFGPRLPDPRLRAAALLSPIPPIGVSAERAYRGVSAPTLHVTGTRDHGYGVPDWQARTLGFRNSAGPAVLAVLEGASHAAFAGEEEIGGHWNDPTYQARTAELCRLFFERVLNGSAGAREALVAGTGLQPGDVLEVRDF